MSDLTTKKVLQLRCNNEIGYSLCSLRRPSRCSVSNSARSASSDLTTKKALIMRAFLVVIPTRFELVLPP